MRKKLSPSILSADFGNLQSDLDKIKNGGAEYVHIDVMDGNFVPNITIGIPVIKSIRNKCDMIFDVHLMIENPDRYIEDFSNAGADIINFHFEATHNPEVTIKKIKSFNKKVGITIKPNTNIEDIFPYLQLVDLVLIMTVEPGFGGQSFMDNMLTKVVKLKNEKDKNNLSFEIEVDGGINLNNVEQVLESGADVIVAGSSVYGAENVIERVKEFQIILKKYENV